MGHFGCDDQTGKQNTVERIGHAGGVGQEGGAHALHIDEGDHEGCRGCA